MAGDYRHILGRRSSLQLAGSDLIDRIIPRYILILRSIAVLRCHDLLQHRRCRPRISLLDSLDRLLSAVVNQSSCRNEARHYHLRIAGRTPPPPLLRLHSLLPPFLGFVVAPIQRFDFRSIASIVESHHCGIC